MKTPKRDPEGKRGRFVQNYFIIDRSRWKRKNKISQYKRTIARLTHELQNEREKSSFFYVAYSRLAEFARNAKQNNLLCADAEQLTERKEQS